MAVITGPVVHVHAQALVTLIDNADQATLTPLTRVAMDGTTAWMLLADLDGPYELILRPARCVGNDDDCHPCERRVIRIAAGRPVCAGHDPGEDLIETSSSVEDPDRK